MYSFICATLGALVTWVAVSTLAPHSNYAILPTIVVFIAAYILLARRHWKAVEALMTRAGKEVQQQRVDHAIRILEEGYSSARWVFLLKGQLDGQLGAFHFMQKDFDKAQPLLEAASGRHWVAKGMLAAHWFRHHKAPKAMAVLNKAIASNKKEAMLYGMGAWMQVKLKDRDAARAFLIRGKKVLSDHDAITENLVRLQNGQDMKMTRFGEAWWQFHLEKPSQRAMMKMAGQTGLKAKGAKKSMYR